MKTGQFAYDVATKTVKACHTCQTKDGDIVLEQTFDFSKCSTLQLLQFAVADRKIAWRVQSGIKQLTKAEAEKLNGITIDCSQSVKKERHTQTAEEKQISEAVALATKEGVSMAEILAAVQAKLAEQKALRKELEELATEEGEEK